MIKINLLPPQQKKEISLMGFTSLATDFIIWFGFFLIVFIAFLLSTYFSLTILLEAQDDLIHIREQDPRVQSLIEIEEKIKQINQDLKQISQKQENMIVWVPILEELSRTTPNGIYIANLSYFAANQQIDLVGWARNRASLISFEKNLEESPYFIDLISPLSNLLRQTNINFNLKFKIAQ